MASTSISGGALPSGVPVFTPAVELVLPGSLPRSERKAKQLYRLYKGEQP